MTPKMMLNHLVNGIASEFTFWGGEGREILHKFLFTYIIEIDIKTGNLIWPKKSQRRQRQSYHQSIACTQFLFNIFHCKIECVRKQYEQMRKRIPNPNVHCYFQFCLIWWVIRISSSVFFRCFFQTYFRKTEIFCCIRSNFNVFTMENTHNWQMVEMHFNFLWTPFSLLRLI